MAQGGPVGGGQSLGAAQGRITINTQSVTAAASQVQGAAASMTRSLGSVGPAAAQAQRSVAGLSGALGDLGDAFNKGLGKAVAGAALGAVAFSLAQTAAQTLRVRDAFDELAAQAGTTGDEMLTSLRTASRGTISDANLVLNANRAIVLGVADSAEEITQLLDIARVRGQAMGLSLNEAFTRLALGIGKLEIEILDELGLTVKLIPAYEAYAASVGKAADELSEAEKRQALFNQVLADSQGMLDRAAGSADDSAAKFERFGASLDNARQAAGELLLALGAGEAADTFTQSLTDSQQQIETFQGFVTSLKTQLDNLFDDVSSSLYVAAINRAIEATQNFIATVGVALNLRSDSARFDAPNLASGGSIGGASTSLGGAGGVGNEVAVINQKLLDAQVDYARDLSEIERDAARDRTSATRDYEQQRTDTIVEYGERRAQTVRDYEQGLAREAQDFARQRLRQWADLERQIAGVQANTARQEADWLEELNETVAQTRRESNERVEEIEEDYRKERERAARDHGDNLRNAASRLDASAVAEEQRRYQREREDADADFDEQLSEERRQLDERLAQEQAAHEERLQEAREADARRIQGMRDSLARQQEEEDEDRRLRLERQAIDHQAQLDQMATDQGKQLAQLDRTHRERLIQINQQAADEREELNLGFQDQLDDLGLYNTAYLELQKQRQDDATELFNEMWDDWRETMEEAYRAVYPNQDVPTREESEHRYPDLNDPDTYLPRRNLPSSLIDSASSRSTTSTGSRSGRNVTIGSITINANGLNEEAAYRVAQRALADSLEEAARR